MRIIILGGDGFCGWPTSLHLSQRGHDIVIVDNLSRRNIDIELEVESLTPIRSMGQRLEAWHEVSGRTIPFHRFDVAQNYHRLLTLFKEFRPDAVVHFAEQRAAPYSMKSSLHKRYTVDNNINATHNVLAAIVAISARWVSMATARPGSRSPKVTCRSGSTPMTAGRSSRRFSILPIPAASIT
jgi:UDP-sulfoquinovose synthase